MSVINSRQATWIVIGVAVAVIAAVMWRRVQTSGEADAYSVLPMLPGSEIGASASQSQPAHLVTDFDSARQEEGMESPAPDTSQAVVESGSATQASFPWKSETPRQRTPPEVFEQRHAHRTPDEIFVLAALSLDKHRSLAGPAFDERLERGIFYAKARDGQDLKLGRSDPLVRMIDNGDPGHLNIVWLPYDEYPEVYESSDEHFWLQRRARKLKEQAKSATVTGAK